MSAGGYVRSFLTERGLPTGDLHALPTVASPI